MNFLLHAEVALREQARAPHALGAMLPDLLRMAHRRARARPTLDASVSLSAELSEVQAGVVHHHELDTWFHRQPGFLLGEVATRQAWQDCQAPRMGLFAHATWEMLLDGALIRSRGQDLSRQRFGALADPALALALADKHVVNAKRRADFDAPLFEQRLRRILTVIASFELPGGYASAQGMAQRLTGLRYAFGFPPPDVAELERWLVALRGLEPLADQLLSDVLATAGKR